MRLSTINVVQLILLSYCSCFPLREQKIVLDAGPDISSDREKSKDGSHVGDFEDSGSIRYGSRDCGGGSKGSTEGDTSGSNHHSKIQSISSRKARSMASLSLPITIDILSKDNSISGLGESSDRVAMVNPASWEASADQTTQVASVESETLGSQQDM